mmetsp:Transcript_10178/g.30609  ORF Transcript_10178/g.30609 Transcript_10178/m.30609 type:complete len:202 (-) Transcript_10178:409-1014(-)
MNQIPCKPTSMARAAVSKTLFLYLISASMTIAEAAIVMTRILCTKISVGDPLRWNPSSSPSTMNAVASAACSLSGGRSVYTPAMSTIPATMYAKYIAACCQLLMCPWLNVPSELNMYVKRTWPNHSSPTMPMKHPKIFSTGSRGILGSSGSWNHAFDLYGLSGEERICSRMHAKIHQLPQMTNILPGTTCPRKAPCGAYSS